MKNKNTSRIIFISLTTVIIVAFVYQNLIAQQKSDPWTVKQLMEPADLANTINDPKAEQPLIFCVGPQAVIKNSVYIGPTGEAENLNKFKEQLSKIPKDANIVIYCGCCPFSRCPNVRPAFNLLNEMGFKNQKLLNLAHNIRTDWIAPGYPVQ